MTDMQESGTVPSFEVRILRDGVVVQRELYETGDEADAVVDAWSDVDDVVVEVDDLAGRTAPSGVLSPQPWEVDADDLVYEGSGYDEEEER